MDILDDNIKGTEALLSDKAMSDIKKTAPWIKFMAILGLVFMVLMVLGLLVFIAMGIGVAIATKSPAIFVGLAFFIFSIVLQFWILTSLYSYGARLKDFTTTNNTLYLEKALAKQKTFWMVIGISTLVVLIIYLFAFIAMGSQLMGTMRALQGIH